MKTNLKAKKGFNKIHVHNDLQTFFLTMLKLFLIIIKLHEMIILLTILNYYEIYFQCVKMDV